MAWQLIKCQNFTSLLRVILYCSVDSFKLCFPRKYNSEFFYIVRYCLLLRQIQSEQQQGVT